MSKKKKIAIICWSDPYDRKGLTNAMLGRARLLINTEDYDVDCYMISEYEPWYVRLLRRTPKREKKKLMTLDGVNVHVLWFNYSIVDYISRIRLHGRGFFRERFTKNLHDHFKYYDFIIAHSLDAGKTALYAKKEWNIPYSITWHGSDINVAPWDNPSEGRVIREIIEKADVNYFVSKALMERSDKLTTRGVKKVLHNGCDSRFRKYDEARCEELRKKFCVKGKKVITFAGNLIDIKNPLLLPEIFKLVHREVPNATFWVIGDGKLRGQMEKAYVDFPVQYWGNQPVEMMPDFLNCTDVVVLPSKNEGLPLILVEAMNCGCRAVGSNVGGIKEVIGEKNVLDYPSDDFVEKFAEKVIELSKTNRSDTEFQLKDDFSWKNANAIETSDIKRIIE